MPHTVAPDAAARLSAKAALAMRAAIRLAGGREVCFVATVDADGIVQPARVVARGDVEQRARASGLRAARRDARAQPSVGRARAVGARSRDRRARPRRRHRVRHHRQRGDASSTSSSKCPRAPSIARSSPARVGRRCSAPDGADRATASGATRTVRASARWRSRSRGCTTLGGIGLLEAGTGVGKSLGYLVPALRWAAANNERTVVSTNTINLQEQLVGKDLPFLHDALVRSDQCASRCSRGGGTISASCASSRRARRATRCSTTACSRSSTRFTPWAERTRDGSLSDLTVAPRAEVWDEVAAEADLCTRRAARTSTTASCSRRGGKRRRPTSSS